MIYLTPIKRRILRIMRAPGGEHLGTSEIAERLSEPVFRIRAELLDLNRERIVRQDTSRRRLEWVLTEFGAGIAWNELQMGFDL